VKSPVRLQFGFQGICYELHLGSFEAVVELSFCHLCDVVDVFLLRDFRTSFAHGCRFGRHFDAEIILSLRVVGICRLKLLMMLSEDGSDEIGTKTRMEKGETK